MISCCLKPYGKITRELFPGENLESYGYYNEDESIKLEIGIEAETGYSFNSKGEYYRDDTYDYDGFHNHINGLLCNSYLILSFTKTTKYVFGISWMENFNDETEVQTWFASDPTYFGIV